MPKQSPRFGVNSISITTSSSASNSRRFWPGRLSGGNGNNPPRFPPAHLGRTQHAARLDPRNLTFDASPPGNTAPINAVGAQADGHIRSAANDLQRLRIASRPRSPLASDRLGDAEPSPSPDRPQSDESRGSRLDTIHFQTGHGQLRRQFGAGRRGIDPFSQPLLADFHAGDLTETAVESADRCRRTAAGR